MMKPTQPSDLDREEPPVFSGWWRRTNEKRWQKACSDKDERVCFHRLLAATEGIVRVDVLVSRADPNTTKRLNK